MGSCEFSMADEQVSAQDAFVPASTSSEWYKNLERFGSCLRLHDLLVEEPALVHELGLEGITVLHKGVQHGCVKLVRYILVDMFDDHGKCICSLCGGADPPDCVLTREGLLRKTCEYGSTAVNMAVVSGSPKMVLLLKWAIDMSDSHKNTTGLAGGDSAFQDKAAREYWSFQSTLTGVCPKETGSTKDEATSITNVHLEVPDVKDDAFGENISGRSTDVSDKMILKVYQLIEEKLNEKWGENQNLMDMLKDRCKENVDFGFVPIAHVFVHFLLSLFPDKTGRKFRKLFLRKILVACSERDQEEEENSGSMLVTLFSILDPRGRPILHAAFLGASGCLACDNVFKILHEMEETACTTPKRIRECVNTKDGAGRTILHLACIHDDDSLIEFHNLYSWALKGNLDGGVIMSPLCAEELEALRLWCFPKYERAYSKDYEPKPMHLAVVFNNAETLESMLTTSEGVDKYINAPYAPASKDNDLNKGKICGAFQMAAFLNRATIVEHFLKYHAQSKSIEDLGLHTYDDDEYLPAIHCAAVSGQVEAIHSILKFPIYDPICQVEDEGTALHFILKMENFMEICETFNILALLHVLPNNERYMEVKNSLCKLDDVQTVPRKFSDDEISCINLLYQAGIDLWIPTEGYLAESEPPTVGTNANNEARKWWFDKVVAEVVTQKASITGAANATSVIGALLATTSFVGPLQPPLGYSNDNGYIDTTRSLVRVYLVSNNLSFFFSIASILMALIPAIPIPKESLYDELFRSQRCLKGAAMMLLVAINCTLISFSSASIVVVSSDWHDKQLSVACVVVGGMICALVLGIYIIRLLRMVFHRNNRFRRWFANNMYF